MNAKLRLYKKDADYTYAIGVFATLELLAHRPEQVRQVLLSAKGQANQGVAKIMRICEERGIPARVAAAQVARLAGNEASFAVGVLNKYEMSLAPETNHVVLVNPSDAGNLGTIIRTMLGFEFLDLEIIRPAVDIWDPKTIRASMGAIFQLRFAYFSDLAAYQEQYTQNAYPFMTDGQLDLRAVQMQAPYALVFGNEGAGLGSEFHALGKSIRIAHSARIDSLNLAVSVGIALYAATRRSKI